MESVELFAAIGKALHGPDWKAALARSLNVSDRAVRRWLAGDDIPKGVWSDLHTKLLDREAECSRLAQLSLNLTEARD